MLLSHVQYTFLNYSNSTQLYYICISGIIFVFQANMSIFPKSMFYCSVSYRPSLSRGYNILRGFLEQLEKVTNCLGIVCRCPTLSENSPTPRLCCSLEVLPFHSSCFSQQLLTPLFLSSNLYLDWTANRCTILSHVFHPLIKCRHMLSDLLQQLSLTILCGMHLVKILLSVLSCDIFPGQRSHCAVFSRCDQWP